MPKAVALILNIVRGLLLVASLGAMAAAAVEGGTSADEGLLYLTVAVTAGVASISLAPRLWTVAAAQRPVPGSAGSVTVAPGQPAPADGGRYGQAVPGSPQPGHGQPVGAQAGQPAGGPSEPGQPYPQPTPPAPGQAGQVYGGGTYQGQVYGQQQSAQPEPGQGFGQAAGRPDGGHAQAEPGRGYGQSAGGATPAAQPDRGLYGQAESGQQAAPPDWRQRPHDR